MQAGIIFAYLASAVLTGWLFFHHPLAVGAVPASSVCIVVLYAALRPERAVRSQ